jgi:hypothetical protein
MSKKHGLGKHDLCKNDKDRQRVQPLDSTYFVRICLLPNIMALMFFSPPTFTTALVIRRVPTNGIFDKHCYSGTLVKRLNVCQINQLRKQHNSHSLGSLYKVVQI